MNNLTNQIKASLLSYYKFKIGAKLVATEVATNHGTADVLVLTKSMKVYEIEIKISISDLKNELKKNDKNTEYRKWKYNYPSPNKYYFCVPSSMLEYTVEFASKLNNKYGVIEYRPTKYYMNRFRIIKKASFLHILNDTGKYENAIIQRIDNDLCRRYSLLYPIK